MKTKLVKESLDDFIPSDQEQGAEETNFTPEQKSAIESFIEDYQGDFEDEDIHNLAEELGLDKSEVEEYIYNMARNGTITDEPIENAGKKGFHDDIQKDTLENKNYRKVIYTGKTLQLVLMTLKPGENIGMEHHASDQFFRFEGGTGKCIVNGNEYDVKDGSSVLVPGGAEHDVINTGKNLLQLYTIYGPPNHIDGIIKKTKEEAEGAEKSGEDKFDGTTTE